MRRRILAALLLVMAAGGPVDATEGVATEVDATLKFGAGCRGSGTVELWDPEGHTVQGEAVLRTRLTWSAGYTIRIRTAFSGAASPHLRVIDSEGIQLFAFALRSIGPMVDGDGYDIVCSRQRYSARPDFIGWLGGTAVLVGLLVSLARLRSRWRSAGPTPAQ